ncbi:hypothetical protein [Arthrobacter sp. HLT1-20]
MPRLQGTLPRGVVVPQGLATGAVIGAVFALLAGFAVTVIIAVAQFIEMSPQYASQFGQIGRSITAWLGSVGIGQAQAAALLSSIERTTLLPCSQVPWAALSASPAWR